MDRRQASGDLATEERRLQALEGLQLLEPAANARFQRVVRLAQRLFDVPTALVTLVGEHTQYKPAGVGDDLRPVARSDSFCNLAIEQAEPFVVNDATTDPRFRGNPLVDTPGGIRFYAGQPITAPNGARVGALCLVDRRSRDITPDELATLRQLADFVEAEMSWQAELDRASAVQRQLLPRRAPVLDGYDVAATCVPAAFVGGDFYDWYEVTEGYQFVLADVMGKGVPAGIVAAGVRSAMRTASRFYDLERAFNLAAVGLEPDLDEVGSFATVFVARLHLDSHTVTYVDAGHGIAGVVTADGTAVRFESDGLPLGAPVTEPWRSARYELAAGDTLVCLSDGLLDLFEDIDQAQEAIRDTVTACGSAQEVVDVVTRFAREQAATDDVTALVVRRTA